MTVTLAILLLSVFAVSEAQQGGTFVGSLGLGLTAAQGDFSDQTVGFSAGSGFGLEGELRFYLWRGFAIGGFVNYMRFGTSYPASEGRLTFNLSQMGGLGKMNFIRLSKGTIYLTGGGGIFTPNAHYYVPDNSYDRGGDDTGFFWFGGLGLSSKTSMRILYELELRYNIGRADYTLDTINSNVWDFIYVGVKLSFASKGKEAPPRF
jgi:hypothetical protein